MNKLTRILVSLALIAYTVVALASVTKADNKLQLKEIKLKNTNAQLKELQLKYNVLNGNLDEQLKLKDANKAKIDELEKQRQELEKQLSVKKAQQASNKAIAAVSGTQVAHAQTSGSCADWIAQAGITDVANAMELIRRESGCNPNAINPESGACGVAQELPCGKSGCALGNGACQIKWMQNYVFGRYGSWAGAVAFHNAHNWY